MFTKNVKTATATPATQAGRRKRGRPRGRTEQGGATRQQLYASATKLIASRGYEATTLREIAKKARVSVGLLYKYFPSKRAVVLELYDQLSAEYAAQALEMPPGTWCTRFLFALKTSLGVLGTQRATLGALLPVLVGDDSDGVLGPATEFSRERVQSVFREAVSRATDAITPEEDAVALGRILYVAHLTVILWWLIDRSPNQRATSGLIAALERAMPALSVALKFKPARVWLRMADALCREGLFGEGTARDSIPGVDLSDHKSPRAR